MFSLNIAETYIRSYVTESAFYKKTCKAVFGYNRDLTEKVNMAYLGNLVVYFHPRFLAHTPINK